MRVLAWGIVALVVLALIDASAERTPDWGMNLVLCWPLGWFAARLP